MVIGSGHQLGVGKIGNLIDNQFPTSPLCERQVWNEKQTHTPISHVHKEFTWFGNMPTSTGRDPVSFFTIEKY
jgi:hypothetical protein